VLANDPSYEPTVALQGTPERGGMTEHGPCTTTHGRVVVGRLCVEQGVFDA
jgi:hypothetical protein